jgi:hypothetical protein
MNDLLNAEPVELASQSLSDTQFSNMVDEPLVENTCQFLIYGGSDGESFAANVELHSMDISKPSVHFADSTTISLGSVPQFFLPGLITTEFSSAKLVTSYLTVEIHSSTINRVSYTEEPGGMCSIILDVSNPSFSKSKLAK